MDESHAGSFKLCAHATHSLEPPYTSDALFHAHISQQIAQSVHSYMRSYLASMFGQDVADVVRIQVSVNIKEGAALPFTAMTSRTF